MRKNIYLDVHSLRAALSSIASLALVFSVLLLMPQAAHAQHRYSLKIKNNSRFDIHRIYMSTTETNKWGPDQLEDEILKSGRTFTLLGIKPGEYDIKFVDEDGDACILRDIKIFESKSWALTTSWLLRCEFQ